VPESYNEHREEYVSLLSKKILARLASGEQAHIRRPLAYYE